MFIDNHLLRVKNILKTFRQSSSRLLLLSLLSILFLSSFELYATIPPVTVTVKLSVGKRDDKGVCRPYKKFRLCLDKIIVTTGQDEGDENVRSTFDGEKITFDFTRQMATISDTLFVEEDTPLSENMSNLFETSKQITLIKGEYLVDFKANKYGSVSVPVYLEALATPINCSLIQDGNFANVSVSGSNISPTSLPWSIGVATPQWSSNNGCDGVGGYVQMWGNNVVGESIKQTLSTPILQGQRYDLSFCAAMAPFQNQNNVNYARVRVVAFNGTAPNRASLPTANATLIYETPNITSTTFQNFTSCSWIADKNYTSIEVIPVNSSNLYDGNWVSWALVDNMKLCQIAPCDGLNMKIYPDQNNQGKCCFKVDLNLQTCMANLKGVRIITPAGVSIGSASAPNTPSGLWTQSSLTSSSVFWSASQPIANSTATNGSLCLTTSLASPFFVTIEWVDNNDRIICRSERKLQCPPPCFEIGKLKSITCLGYNDKGYPMYSYCLDVNNNGLSQNAMLSASNGVFSPNVITIPSGNSVICGTFTANNFPAPISTTFNITTVGKCIDSINIKLPTDCPPKECLNINEIKINCLATNQAGNPTYQYSWAVTNMSGVFPNTITVSGNAGIEATYSNIPNNTSVMYNGILQNSNAVNGQICLTFTVRNVDKVIICTKTVCFTAPRCQNCCNEFDKGVKINSIKRTGITANGDNVAMNMTFTPNRPIRSMTATIVSASRRKTAPTLGAWERIYGDIGGASAIPSPTGPGLRYYGGIAPSTSFVASTQMTREVEWGTNYAGTTGSFSTILSLIFPAPYPGTIFNPSKDELDYFLRISMTDVNCIRCDTLIHITLKRSSSPWNTTTSDFKTNKGGIIENTKAQTNQAVNSNPNSALSIKMTTKENGILSLNLPVNQNPEQKITVIGVGIKPDETIDLAEFTPLSSKFKSLSGMEYNFCEGKLTERESADFSLLYTMPMFAKWNNTVVLKYQLGTDSDTLVDFVDVQAAVPVEKSGGDLLEEFTTQNNKTRTYSLSFTNANKSNNPIANVELRMPKGTKLLAIGSGLGDSILLESVAKMNPDNSKVESYLIPIISNRNGAIQSMALNSGEIVKPIYITVSGGGNDLDCDFATFDENGVILSEGVVKLTTPLAVKNDDGSGGMQSIVLDVYPNPATNSATINLGLLNSKILEIVVSDLQGKEVSKIMDENLLQMGNHAFVLNTSNLSNGTYFVIARTNDGQVITTQIKIAK